MPTSCVVCKHSSQCQRCQIKDLKDIIQKQNYELSYLRKESNPQLKIQIDYSTNFETDNKFLPIKYYGEMIDYGFLTITFDPNKFGLFNQPSDEKNYIFKKLYKSITDQYINQLTGCFEFQKNGTVHAHIIIKTTYKPKEIEDYFRPFFTDDPKNKYAIKSYLLQKEKCEAYLQKESEEFFRYDPVRGLDDGLEEASVFVDCTSKCMGTIMDIIKAATALDESNNHQIKTFVKRQLKRYEINCNNDEIDHIMDQIGRRQWALTPLS